MPKNLNSLFIIAKSLVLVLAIISAILLLAGCNIVMVEVPTPGPSQDGAIVGTIVLDPFVGESNSLVALTGQDWPPDY